MTENKGKTQPENQPDDEDVKGNSMFLNPSLASDMARNRSKDIEKEVRERNRAKDAKR